MVPESVRSGRRPSSGYVRRIRAGREDAGWRCLHVRRFACAPAPAREDTRVRKAIAVMRDRLADPLTLADIADQVYPVHRRDRAALWFRQPWRPVHGVPPADRRTTSTYRNS